MGIPLVDLAAQHAQVAEEVEAGWRSVLDRTAFVLGEEVARFEEEFAAFSGVAHCVGVANGTDALELGLRAAGIGAGDRVALPANTFIATALAVARCGAEPVLVDVDPRTYLLDLDRLADVAGDIRAVVPVHLYGQVAPMEHLRDVVGADVVVMEDAAQAQGATRNGAIAGGLGDIAGTSFYPGKNLGAYGDAGGVLTNDADLATKVRSLRNYGSEVKYHHPEIGFNSRLDTLQAVVLSAKLKRLAGWNEQRRAAAQRYEELLAPLDRVVRPVVLEGNESIWHLYVIRVPNRDEVLSSLHAAGVGAGIHYPVPIHLQKSFAHLGAERGAFPVTEAASDEMISLPMFAEITADQQAEVVDALQAALR